MAKIALQGTWFELRLVAAAAEENYTTVNFTLVLRLESPCRLMSPWHARAGVDSMDGSAAARIGAQQRGWERSSEDRSVAARMGAQQRV
ncbi:hypothetical protein SNOG_03023 [Parastagonospora nodorum SN15]|uniref:Uncharacterized protein n=1 Tax=Phaeosphaeria nodorum (strain SN15 / ATCC MYA-4574 / FGSC 10173) TaxID=321614 RepID=Q0UYZ1_PHANO|nr:hypothetical protein SNOG_03023 [Parastagonospora nodorum SN15]EAT89754.1 hypothetical protein SNOG_03023 [Parastagonospora nodorum SN15]